jgi:hypothetical protein
MRPSWHFCGMAAAASKAPSPELPRRGGHFPGNGPMHRLPAQDSKGMDPARRRPERR